MQLTDIEREQWQDQGYFIREGVFSRGECNSLSAHATGIVDGEISFPDAHLDQDAKAVAKNDGRSGIYAMHKLHCPHLFNQAFFDQQHHPRIVEPVSELIGPDLLGLQTLFIFKAPNLGLGFPWHQDKYYFDRFVTDTTVGTWQAIDDATIENGCLWIIPGSHRGGLLKHDQPGQKSDSRQVKDVDETNAIALEMPAGSVLWFHSNLLHKSIANKTTGFRRCYVTHYLSSTATWLGKVRDVPIMWVRGDSHEGCVQPTCREPAAEEDW